jgi:predicted DNA-binding transcriptional regulator YafY
MSPSSRDLVVNRTDRLYAITEQLRLAGPAGRTAQQLADRFDVSVRTVKRDVSALQQAGALVWAQPGPGGGYVLDAQSSLPPVNITAAEAVSLAVALSAVPDLPFAADGRTALAKVLAVMPEAERRRARDVAARVWTRGADHRRPRTARTVEEAIRRGVVLSIRFRDARGRSTSREVEPVLLALTGGHWHLAAWCRLRQDYRWFRTDRITTAHLGTEPAPRHDPAALGEPPQDAAAVGLDG